MLRNISLWQILVVVLIIVLLFGARRLPDLASSVGKSLKIFKKEVSELREDDDTPAPGGATGGAGSTDASPAPQTGTAPQNPPPSGGDVPGTAGGTGTDPR